MALAGGCGDNKEENTSVCRLLRGSKQFAAQLGDEHSPVHTHSTMQQHRCGGTAPCRYVQLGTAPKPPPGTRASLPSVRILGEAHSL